MEIGCRMRNNRARQERQVMKWTVGQEVFIAKSNNARTTSTARIVKVGRKWATLERVEGRFDLETGMLDGGQCSSLGKVYVNEAEYRTECELNAAWLAFSTKTQCRAPQGITIEAIRAASVALFGVPS